MRYINTAILCFSTICLGLSLLQMLRGTEPTTVVDSINNLSNIVICFAFIVACKIGND